MCCKFILNAEIFCAVTLKVMPTTLLFWLLRYVYTKKCFFFLFVFYFFLWFYWLISDIFRELDTPCLNTNHESRCSSTTIGYRARKFDYMKNEEWFRRFKIGSSYWKVYKREKKREGYLMMYVPVSNRNDNFS